MVIAPFMIAFNMVAKTTSYETSITKAQSGGVCQTLSGKQEVRFKGKYALFEMR